MCTIYRWFLLLLRINPSAVPLRPRNGEFLSNNGSLTSLTAGPARHHSAARISARSKEITTLHIPHLHQRYYPDLECSEKIKKRYLVYNHASLSGVNTIPHFELLLSLATSASEPSFYHLTSVNFLNDYRIHLYLLRSIWLLTPGSEPVNY